MSKIAIMLLKLRNLSSSSLAYGAVETTYGAIGLWRLQLLSRQDRPSQQQSAGILYLPQSFDYGIANYSVFDCSVLVEHSPVHQAWEELDMALSGNEITSGFSS